MEYLSLTGYGVYWNEEEEGRLNEPGDMVGGGSQLRNEEVEEMLCVRMGGGLLVDKHLALFSLSLSLVSSFRFFDGHVWSHNKRTQ